MTGGFRSASGGRLATYVVWGSSTDVGKTLVSAALARAARGIGVSVNYVKPVQTGITENAWDLDGEKVARAIDSSHVLGPHASMATGYGRSSFGDGELHWMAMGNAEDGPRRRGDRAGTLFGWRNPVSPHLAVRLEGRPVRDEDILGAIEVERKAFREELRRENRVGLMLIETAGGPLSPGPSGTLFADLLRPLRFPGVLVGSASLGGITTTLAAKESIEIRGLDLSHVLVLEERGGGRLNNTAAIAAASDSRALKVRDIPPLVSATSPSDNEAYVSELDEWLNATAGHAASVVEELIETHSAKQEEAAGYPKEAMGTFWFPFAQHGLLREQDVSVIESREGDELSILAPPSSALPAEILSKKFDSSASWWTQGPDLPMQMEMGKRIGYAASRYGHVIFPTNAHEPVVGCTRNLLRGPGEGWAQRVFYSDNGSTAIEVGLKMAFRKYLCDKVGKDRLMAEGEGSAGEHAEVARALRVVTQTGAYHGDTLACMNAVEKSVYTGPIQFPWNVQQCLPVQPAYVRQKGGSFKIRLPGGGDLETGLRSMADFFEANRPGEEETREMYGAHIESELGGEEGLGALLIEPICQGAGGMKFIDPLWQRELIRYCREERGMPVIFDEIFVGLYRLGLESAKDYLRVVPDVACYGKLLTLGTVPLGVTLSSEEIFSCFLDDKKENALLHGHSYTAHPVGCAAANFAFDKYNDLLKGEGGAGREYWNVGEVGAISGLACVESAVSLGTVLSVELGGDQGYTSQSAESVVRMLADRGVHCRPLGNVLYFMASPFTSRRTCDRLLRLLREVLTLHTLD